MKLHYFWLDCSDGSHVAVNYTIRDEGVSGSMRRWSPDRSVNVGRKFEIPPDRLRPAASGGMVFVLDGVCAQEILVPIEPQALREAGPQWNRAA